MFVSPATACLFAPLPWEGGTEIAMTAGDDLNGETAGALDLLSISVSGSNGYVFVYQGDYFDATGSAGAIGQLQQV